MRKVSDLANTGTSLARIKPPGESFEDWHRFLEECRAEGVSDPVVTTDGSFVGFASPFGLALLKRYRWLTDAEARGICFEQAAYEWEAMIERDGEQVRHAETERLRTVVKAQRERDKPPPRESLEDQLHRDAERLRGELS